MASLAELPKVEEILTKAERERIPKIPPKIGETYYREIQTPGDLRWYFGGGTADQLLDESVVQEKIKKAESETPEWMKERLAALEGDKSKESPVIVPQAEQEELEKDKAAVLSHMNPKSAHSDVQHLHEGETIKLHNG